MDLAPRGCAVVHGRAGRLRSCYVKGVNEQAGTGAPPYVRYGRDLVTTGRPADLTALPGLAGFVLRTAP